MSRVVQLFVILCCQVKLTLALSSCTGDSSISICTDERRQGGHVYVDFSSVPLQENNVSCSCFIFAPPDTEILTTYKTSQASDIKLVNTSIRLGDQTFQEASKGYIHIAAYGLKKLHFNGEIDKTSPGVCLTFNSSSKINIEVVCLRNNNTTIPISGFATQTISTAEQPTSSTAKQSTSTTPEQSTSSTAEHPTPSTPEQSTTNKAEQTTSGAAGQPTSSTSEQSTSSTAEQTTSSAAGQPTSDTADLSQHGDQPDIIGGAVGGGIVIVVVVVIVVIVVAVVIFRRRRLSTRAIKKQTTTDTTDSQRDNDETHNYVNTLQISAGEHNQTSENTNYEVLSSNRCEAIYDQPILNITSGV